MLSQPVVENVGVVTYVENYLDCIENLPDDIQRFLSRMHELDISYRGYLRDVEHLKEVLEKDDQEPTSQRKALCKLEQVLISLQEVGDEKVEIGQQIMDLIDNKYRQLEQDFRNIDLYKDQENADPSHHVKESVTRDQNQSSVGGGSAGTTNSNGGNGVTDRPNKRPRRSRGDQNLSTGLDISGESLGNDRVSRSVDIENTTGRGSGSGGGSGGQSRKAAGGKKKKRKSGRVSQQQSSTGGEDTVAIGSTAGRVPEEELQHDVDEPTYCLCDQISYGEMILCDNDLCPIEWFHFVCVSLTSKPKGKWFCPKCRGDRPNVMKPKSQFLKELERYNKEKEEKS